MRTRIAMRTLLVLLGAGLPHSAQANGIQRVWAVDDGERIKKTAINHSLATSTNNKVWNGTSVSIFGARNEVVAFQLIIQGNASGATNVNVTLDSLRKSTSPVYTIKNTGGIGDPYNYVGKRIEMFVQHYMNITERSNSTVLWWSGARPLPDGDYTGLVPEQLVPFEAPAGPKANGQGGAPFSVTANQNQGVWVDIYIPRDAPPGTYTGTLRVTEGGVQRYAFPVNLQVYNFTLSDTTHFKNFFHIGSPALTGRHGVTKGSGQYWTLMKRYYAMGHRHRMEVTDGGLTLGTFATYLGPLYTGAYYSAGNNYEGPGAGVGNGVYSVGTYDQPRTASGTDRGSTSGFTYSSDLTTFRNTWHTASNQWMEWFRTNAPGTLVFKYMADEPGGVDTSIFADMRMKAGWLKSNPGVGRFMKTLCTTNIRPDLRGTIDIWMGTGQSGYIGGGVNPYPGGYVVDSANAARLRGEMAGFYNATVPAFGSNMIDAPATHMRVNSWIAWKYNADMYFLWYINHYGDEDGTPIDPWLGDRRRRSWGSGSFLYPGENKNSTLGNDRGLPGPIAGIRLKNWRRGAQDYEYLWRARQLRLTTGSIVHGVVAGGFDDVAQNEGAQFRTRGWEFEDRRRQLAELIVAASSPQPFGTFSAVPNELTDGPGPVTLQWSSTNATSASIDRGIGTVAVNGSRVVTVDSTTTFTLTLTNSQGSRSYQATVTVRQIPSGSFNAVPDTVPTGGGSTTLSWTSSGATTASISPGVGSVAVNGSRAVPVTSLTTFTLTLSNSDGTRLIEKKVFVRTPPTGSLQVFPDSIDAEGGDVTLRWTSTNALTARFDHGIGMVEPSDSLVIFLTIPTTFNLSLQNPFGRLDLSASVFQRPARPAFVTIPPESLTVKDPLTGRVKKPARRGRNLFPNWGNLLSELVIQGGFQPGATESDRAGGLVVGLPSMDEVGPNRFRPNPDSAAAKTWVRLSKWNFGKAAGSSFRSIITSLEGREGPHTGLPRGFDSTGSPGEGGRRLLLKQQTRLNPNRHNNRLFAELVSLKVAIAASQIQKTPVGFGELIYDLNTSSCDELTIRQIADRADSVLSHWRGRSSAVYNDLYTAIYLINRAFAAPMDTIHFEDSGQLRLRGVVELASVPFLRLGSEPPHLLLRTNRLTSLPEDDLEEAVIGDEENPAVAELLHNYPNPFNPTTTISVGLREPALVTVQVFNLLGQEVRTLAAGEDLGEGIHEFTFDAAGLASGVYFTRVRVMEPETGYLTEMHTRKMILMK